jgi:hypothetical protein
MVLATRLFIALVFAGVFGVVVWASQTGYGVSPLKNENLYREMLDDCPEDQQRADGSCPPRSYRSFFIVPIVRGGFRGRAGK